RSVLRRRQKPHVRQDLPLPGRPDRAPTTPTPFRSCPGHGPMRWSPPSSLRRSLATSAVGRGVHPTTASKAAGPWGSDFLLGPVADQLRLAAHAPPPRRATWAR